MTLYPGHPIENSEQPTLIETPKGPMDNPDVLSACQEYHDTALAVI